MARYTGCEARTWGSGVGSAFHEAILCEFPNLSGPPFLCREVCTCEHLWDCLGRTPWIAVSRIRNSLTLVPEHDCSILLYGFALSSRDQYCFMNSIRNRRKARNRSSEAGLSSSSFSLSLPRVFSITTPSFKMPGDMFRAAMPAGPPPAPRKAANILLLGTDSTDPQVQLPACDTLPPLLKPLFQRMWKASFLACSGQSAGFDVPK